MNSPSDPPTLVLARFDVSPSVIVQMYRKPSLPHTVSVEELASITTGTEDSGTICGAVKITVGGMLSNRISVHPVQLVQLSSIPCYANYCPPTITIGGKILYY